MSRRFRSVLIAALAATAAALATASPAAAGPLVASVADCDNGAVSKPFAPWLDYANYFRVPGGDFTGAAEGWTLDGASTGAGALSLPAGASATSPAVCVGLEHPTTRFFVRRTGGSLLATVRVEALTETASGGVVSLPIGFVAAGTSRNPSPILVNVVNLLPLLPGDHAPMALRFTAVGGSFEVDDVWVDPWGRG